VHRLCQSGLAQGDTDCAGVAGVANGRAPRSTVQSPPQTTRGRFSAHAGSPDPQARMEARHAEPWSAVERHGNDRDFSLQGNAGLLGHPVIQLVNTSATFFRGQAEPVRPNYCEKRVGLFDRLPNHRREKAPPRITSTSVNTSKRSSRRSPSRPAARLLSSRR
jgi:hypothetical protein